MLRKQLTTRVMKNNFQAKNINLLSPYEQNLLIHIDDFLYPIMGYKCLGDLHDDLTVEISTLGKKRTYEVEMNDPDPQTGAPRVYRRPVNIDILGEYISRDQTNGPRVILYINTIRGQQPTQTELLIAEVYVHEIMHAYFDTSNGHVYEEKVEEPITEFAMLKFFEAFDQGASSLKVLSSALNNVQAKQNGSIGIKCYGFGYYLFTQMSSTPWRELLYHAKTFNSQCLKEYSTPFIQGTYPFHDESKYAKLLYGLLADSAMIMGSMNIHSKHIRYIHNLEPLAQSILNKINHTVRLGDLVDVKHNKKGEPFNAPVPAILFNALPYHLYITNSQQAIKCPKHSYILSLKSSISPQYTLQYIYACLLSRYLRVYSMLVNYRTWNGLSLEEVRSLPIPIIEHFWPDSKNYQYILDLASKVAGDISQRHQFAGEIENAFKFTSNEINYLKNDLWNAKILI